MYPTALWACSCPIHLSNTSIPWATCSVMIFIKKKGCSPTYFWRLCSSLSKDWCCLLWTQGSLLLWVHLSSLQVLSMDKPESSCSFWPTHESIILCRMVAFTLLQTLCRMSWVRFRAWESNAHQWTNRLCTHRINRSFGCTCEALQGASGYWAAAEWQHRLAVPDA